MSRTIAFLDSCVIYPFSLRDILIQFSVDGLFQAKWSTLIRQEVIRNVEKDNPSARGKLGRTFDLMEKAIPDFLTLPTEGTKKSVRESETDRKDVDILAAAIDGNCTHLVTSNLKDFDIAFASARGVIVIHPDEFISGLISKNPSQAQAGFEAVIARCKNPPRSKTEYVEAFKKNHLLKTADALSGL